MVPYRCGICHMTMSSQEDLKAHAAIDHPHRPASVKLYGCGWPSCGKCFFSNANLQRHWVVHTDFRQFRCAECGKTFTQKIHLKRHYFNVHFKNEGTPLGTLYNAVHRDPELHSIEPPPTELSLTEPPPTEPSQFNPIAIEPPSLESAPISMDINPNDIKQEFPADIY